MKKEPLRMCLGCREMKQKSELLRIVRSPEGVVSIDLTFKGPGRGAYICKNPECFKRIIKSRAISRTLKTEIRQDIYDEILEQLNG